MQPQHKRAGAQIPTLMSLHVVLATSPTMSGAARVGAEVERSPCDHSFTFTFTFYSYLMARAGVHAPSVRSLQAMPDISSHAARCIHS